MSNAPTPTPPNPEDALRPHSYDGIHEFDKRLPNWWLMTLYAAVVFWIGYWSYYQWWRVGPSSAQRIQKEVTAIEAEKLALAAANRVDDPGIWAMSRNPDIVAQGQAIFTQNCIPCHKASLRGVDDGGIGADLRLTSWLHGGHPTDLVNTVTHGVPEKGMPTWGPILGQRKIVQVVAYVMSYHHEGEPMTIRPRPPAPK